MVQCQPWPPPQASRQPLKGMETQVSFLSLLHTCLPKPCSRLLLNRCLRGAQRQHEYLKACGLGFMSTCYWGKRGIRLKEYSSFGQVQVPAGGQGAQFPELIYERVWIFRFTVFFPLKLQFSTLLELQIINITKKQRIISKVFKRFIIIINI